VSEWSPYAVIFKNGEPPENSARLQRVFHIVHAKIFRRILEDEFLRSGLVRDESILKKSRICVTWLSANDWYQGSIYGTVRFSFDWESLVEDKRIYWVEVIPYPNPAYRFLLTDRDLGTNRHVKPYDPVTDKGPLRKKDGSWYWNNQYTSEFMIESDISILDAVKIDFVEHTRCKEAGNGCRDNKLGRSRVGGEVTAFALGNAIHCIDRLLRDDEGLTMAAEQGIASIYTQLASRDDYFGGKLARTQSNIAVVRGALALLGSGQKEAARALVGMLRTKACFDEALETIVRKHLKIKSWSIGD
jgi:hypothetical protein